MKIIIFFLVITHSLIGNSKPLFIGDSLTYQIASSYKAHHPVDAFYLESSGLQSNKILDWQNHIKIIPLKKYDTVYIILGTNDLIHNNEIKNYQLKAQAFIRSIKKQNPSIVWLLPPELKNEHKNALLKNTRIAIQHAGKIENIKLIDIRHTLGMRYIEKINNLSIRTKDGVHITKNGGDKIVQLLLNDSL